MNENERKKDKRGIIFGVVVAFMVIAGLSVYLLAGIPPEPSEITLSLIVVVVVVLAFMVIRDKFKSYKAGLPAKDEMTTKIMHKAGYYAWMFAIYAALISRFIGEEVAEKTGSYELIGTYMTIAVILGSALFFFVMYFYFSRKGV